MRTAAPEEICGCLLMRGTQWRTEMFVQVANVDEDSEHFYRMHPDSQMETFLLAEELGLRVGGLFHTHTKRDARMSSADREMAAYQSCMYVIMSMDPREIRAWSRWQDEWREHPVIIDPGKPGLDYCDWHKRYEDQLRSHSQCFECGHVFGTAWELMEQGKKMLDVIYPDRDNRFNDPKDVLICPYCAHDFVL